MEAPMVERAIAAATRLAEQAGLPVDEALVVHNSNKLAVRLLRCDALARVAVVGEEVAALEVELATQLEAHDAPTARLDPRVEPRVHEDDGFAVTFWTFEATTPTDASAHEYASGLERLHSAMREITVPTPHFTERVDEAEQLVEDLERTPRLAEPDRELLRAMLRDARRAVLEHGADEQLLHGEPHPGNVLRTVDGPVFIDLETCCRGPVEFDLAHTPEDVAARYESASEALLGECRRLVLAMVAAWRWDIRDQFPDGHRVGYDLLAAIRRGPPWITLDALETIGDDSHEREDGRTCE